MMYLCVASWSGNKITAEADAPDEATAIAKVAGMVAEGYADAFYVVRPAGDWRYFVADGVAKTVVFDTVTYDADQAALPAQAWERQMAENDQVLPRYAEDLYDALNPSDQANVSQSTKNKVAAKKSLRATKP